MVNLKIKTITFPGIHSARSFSLDASHDFPMMTTVAFNLADSKTKKVVAACSIQFYTRESRYSIPSLVKSARVRFESLNISEEKEDGISSELSAQINTLFLHIALLYNDLLEPCSIPAGISLDYRLIQPKPKVIRDRKLTSAEYRALQSSEARSLISPHDLPKPIKFTVKKDSPLPEPKKRPVFAFLALCFTAFLSLFYYFYSKKRA